MLEKTVNVNLKISDYSNRVLGVVKEKYGFKDKSQALDKIMDMYGEEFVEKEVREDVILEVIAEVEKMKKQKQKPMSKSELNMFFENAKK
ncbi:MAG TPA: DUF2683 family protein [Candidatus Diapherotrites archaeon]|jgi:hypothetical protein|nr:DUF2683 family protein [Candidatus Diapherotrites archaeon]